MGTIVWLTAVGSTRHSHKGPFPRLTSKLHEPLFERDGDLGDYRNAEYDYERRVRL